MSYADLTFNSKNVLKRFSHQRRFDTAIKLIALNPGETILDYGTGDGHMMALLKETCSDLSIVGYDPFPDEKIRDVCLRHPDIIFFQDRKFLNNSVFDKVCCFETLEHFEYPEVQDHVDFLCRSTRPNGKIFVSVPVEIGPPSIVKNLVRMKIGLSHNASSIGNILRCAFYRPGAVKRVKEDGGGYIQSHLGFNFRKIPEYFRECCVSLEYCEFSPFNFMGSLTGSQVFFCFRKS
ncbi:Methyltransferase domain-containing protein [Agrobacterium fabrum]|uniref:Methyltransferase domain-containing protein n=1 Tax=Agrobacterium fabrum TaxID=1176649 RepID=A0A7Z7BNJ6_9HYPH|nr:methyltransferase domain-containing protein [Agrobacterium fabrum]SDJ80970.1 Methyltransferase domain-containing protein [Agrobacterium fabrum]